MAMSVGESADGEVMVDINTTPLIDVMLVLLTLLVITLPIQTHAVKLDMPRPNTPPPPVQPVTIDLAIDFDGTITWNGVVVPGEATLESKLEAAAQQPVQPEVHINPNKLANYGTVIGVMAAAEREGVTKIGIVGNEQFAP